MGKYMKTELITGCLSDISLAKAISFGNLPASMCDSV